MVVIKCNSDSDRIQFRRVTVEVNSTVKFEQHSLVPLCLTVVDGFICYHLITVFAESRYTLKTTPWSNFPSKTFAAVYANWGT